MATAVEFDFATKTERAIPASTARASCEAGMFCWVDLDADADPTAAEAILRDLGATDPVIREALGPDVDGRHDLYDECLHIAVTSATLAPARAAAATAAASSAGPSADAVPALAGSLVPSHVDIVIGERYLVTLRRGEVAFIEKVRRHYRQDFVKFAKTPSFLLYEYFDALVASYKQTLRLLAARVEGVQERIFGSVDDAIFNEVAAVTRDLLSFRKIMLAAREVLHELSSRRSPFVSESTQPFLEKMVGTLERLSSDLAVEREILAETLNLYMGIVSHRTNKVVNRLTVVSMVFLPLTFLCGVYGMNFDPATGPLSMPELGWRFGYLAFWLVAVAMTVALLIYMKRKRWW